MGTSLRSRDYRSYRFEGGERIRAVIIAAGVVGLLALAFYRSAWAIIPLAPLGCLVIRLLQDRKAESVRENLAEQFKECILSVSASLQAGYAVENAFLESRADMRNLYGEQSYIYQELERIRRGMAVNISLEELLQDLGERSGSEEIEQFAQLFSIAKRGGGNLPEMIRTSANLIGRKMEARQEVGILLAGRKMEQNIMRIMPFGILLYVGKAYPGYFDPLYHNLQGIALMNLCLVLYLAAVLIGEKVFQGIWRQMNGTVGPAKLPGLGQKGILGKAGSIGETVFSWWSKSHPAFPGRARIRRDLEMLCPEEPKEELLKKYFGGKIGLSLVVFILGSGLAACLQIRTVIDSSGGNTALVIWLMTIAAAAAVFFLMDKDLRDQAEKRKKVMRLGYPDLVHGLALYLVAGLNIRGAFQKLGERNELVRMACREIQAGQSEAAAYERFGKRAGPREYVRLSTLLCQNLKKGTGTLLARLEEEAVTAAENRVQDGKRLGEEAETKLLVPMVMLLAVVMVMVMLPAFWAMGV